jgi:hypothetical protein
LGLTDQTDLLQQMLCLMIGKCIAAIHTEDERIDAQRMYPTSELEEFIDSMTK